MVAEPDLQYSCCCRKVSTEANVDVPLAEASWHLPPSQQDPSVLPVPWLHDYSGLHSLNIGICRRMCWLENVKQVSISYWHKTTAPAKLHAPGISVVLLSYSWQTQVINQTKCLQSLTDTVAEPTYSNLFLQLYYLHSLCMCLFWVYFLIILPKTLWCRQDCGSHSCITRWSLPGTTKYLYVQASFIGQSVSHVWFQ